MALLVSGFRNYVKLQYFMWYAILASFLVMVIAFFAANPASAQSSLNSFAASVDGVQNFFATAKAAAADAGVNFNPPFWLFGTLMVAPIAWTSLQWASYSVEQGGEIKNAHVFRNQLFILVGSLAVTAALLIVLALAMQNGLGREGVQVASSGYWLGVSEATIGGTFLMPNLLAIALTASPLLILVIGIGYILNSFQIVCNCYIGTTRILMAQSFDGLLPEWLSRVHPRWRTPVNAHLAYFLASLPVIWAFNKVPDWSTKWALGVTFANGATMVVTALAAALLPYRAKALYEASPGSRLTLGGLPLVTVLGGLGFLLGAFMVGAYLIVPNLGLAFDASNPTPYGLVVGTLVFGLAVYFLMKQVKASQGVHVEYAFRQIPPE
jgi:amino acid transporter